MASIWNLPVIFYCINNGYGISADIKKMTNVKHIHERSAAYGIPGMFIPDGNNVIDVYEGFQKAVEHVRSGKGPVLIEVSLIVGLVTHLQILVNTEHVKKSKSGRRKIRLKTFASISLKMKLRAQKNWIRSKKK